IPTRRSSDLFWVKIFQHVHFGVQSMAAIKVVVIFTAPEESLPVSNNFDTFCVYAPGLQQVHISIRKISTNNGYNTGLYFHKRSGKADIGGSSTKNFICFSERSFYSIKGHTAYYE